MATADSGRSIDSWKKSGAVWETVAAIAILLLAYSQTLSLAWDEGFHLLASQLIVSGKRPYLDFIFAQTSLNAWWVALWMRLFGQSWHMVHALATVESVAAVALLADYVYRRFPAAEWRVPAAIAAAAMTGLNVMVVEFGTLGQAYGICLLLTVAAFRFTVIAPGRASAIWPALAGLAAGGAAASSLLTATVAPVLLIWIWWNNRAGIRWWKAVAFAAGVFVAFLPMLPALLAAPNRVIFDVLKFHLYYRQAWWEGWQLHDLEVMTAWLDSSQALILGALGIAGWMFVRRGGWAQDARAEYDLCAWLTVSMSAFLMTTHPTFTRYFVFVVPFVSVLAAAGLFAIVGRMKIPLGARWPVALLVALTAAGLGRSVYEDSTDSWYRIDALARKVAEVTPRGGMLYAEEPIYFLLHWTPPPGFEWYSSHKIDVPPAQAAALQIVPWAEVVRRVKAGVFDTVETCGDTETDELAPDRVYQQKAEVDDCSVFWQRKATVNSDSAKSTGTKSAAALKSGGQ